MESGTSWRGLAVAFITIAVTALLYWFGNSLNPWWPLLWFMPLPVLLYATDHRWWSTALAAFLSLLIGTLNMWEYIHLLGGSPTLWLRIFAEAALVFTIAVLLFRALLLRGAHRSALLAFPATWVSYEYLRTFITPHGTSGSLAYSQLEFLPFLQLASLTGPWGISFLLMLFPAALAIGLHLRQSNPIKALRIVGVSLGVILLVVVVGSVRLALPAPPETVKVGLMASDQSGNVNVAAAGAESERLFREYATEAEKLISRGAQIIVLPEKLAVIADPGTAETVFQSLADKTGCTIIVGSVYVSPPFRYNEARIYSKDLPVQTYDKHHMLPPFESNLKPGTTLTLLRRPGETWGVAICKDMDFTSLSRLYGVADAGLMLVPAWDFNLDRAWHGHIAVMRGVENGFNIVRAAKNGFLTVSDNRGRILAETESGSAPFATLLADVPTMHDRTLYTLLGDWFAWLAVATFAFCLLQLFRSKTAAS